MYSAGSSNRKVVIIGFSLPEHDEYIKQPLFHIIDSFQNYDPNLPSLKKSNLKIIDYKKTEMEIDDFKDRYKFINWEKTDFSFDGFNLATLDIIFD